MKKLIVFDTKTGTSEKCAHLLAEKLDNVAVYDLRYDMPSIEGFDLIIIGGGYYAGMFTGKIKKFIKQNKASLLTKNFAVFVCCAGEDTYKEVLIKNIGEDLANHSIANECFGYEANIESAKGFFNKLIIKMMIKNCQKTNKPVNNIHHDKIEIFANIIKEL